MRDEIPLIDIERWVTGSADERAELAAAVDGALRTSGFLLVSGHGIAPSVRGDLRAAAHAFFASPPEVKERYATFVGGRGWVPPGKEANAYYGEVPDAAKADLKESWASGRQLVTGDPDVDADWFAPNVWPAEVPAFEPAATRFAEEGFALFITLLEIFDEALGLPLGWFAGKVQRTPYTVGINHYPSMRVTGPPVAGQYRIAPHTDWGTITILDRQLGAGGLQVERLDGTWIDAPWVDDAFTINIGDLLARWTGDRWRSTRHRVLPPQTEAPDEALMSLVLFYDADVDAVVEPLPPPIGNVCDHPPITAGDYLRERVAAAAV